MILRLLFPIFLMLTVFLLLIQTLNLTKFEANGTIGSGFLPMALAFLLIILLAMESFSVFSNESKKETKETKGTANNLSQQLLFMGLIILTLIMVNVLGMLISLGLFIFVVLFKMEKRSLINSAFFSLISIFILYITFVKLLSISFPMGLLD
ncbi:tripartite tricarboxylate transporter TctB family protein [Metabacillus herbersteinensis]|uniref:Tripartite tricarboxylate transporter TctB family protein n=1 Tax=Metabacillus herbersteinensis TaxID=283816 RepID=A0ABV6GKD0_9BACI